MYIKNGIAYAGEQQKPITLCGVRPLADYLLWLRFSTGECRLFDFKALLNKPAFTPLKEESVFQSVYIDYGCLVWADGDIDIDAAYLYKNSTSVDFNN